MSMITSVNTWERREQALCGFVDVWLTIVPLQPSNYGRLPQIFGKIIATRPWQLHAVLLETLHVANNVGVDRGG